jgi:hypothetical protein
MLKVGQAYGLPAFNIATVQDLEIVRRELDAPGPALFDVHLDPAQEFEPRLRSKILPDGKITTPISKTCTHSSHLWSWRKTCSPRKKSEWLSSRNASFSIRTAPCWTQFPALPTQ